jgi:hypothetical protein
MGSPDHFMAGAPTCLADPQGDMAIPGVRVTFDCDIERSPFALRPGQSAVHIGPSSSVILVSTISTRDLLFVT